ncbi:MAG: DNA topoisomerase IV subunit A [Alphaproteobacteria bacterium]|nr:DNA topoisomerase IV subunit A [Alphaproteobacteria bacterium]
MSKKDQIPDTHSIQNVDFEKALSERYLAYALSTIMSRSLPDVRDGLKPVHRRLIYAMQQLRLDPKSGFKKCARVVGDVMGKFHPHWDSAIYGALVRLAQDFSVRYPLIEGQGNFGNIDGDSAAAMRYTEARLSQISIFLMDGLDENAVDFRPTYDGEGEEPIVFPAAFPNLLANGSTGIAVGMATSVPPHNLEELCQALVYLIDHPDATNADLLPFIPGPDFPTGGVLIEEPDVILRAYETGRGSFRLRAHWETEEQKGGAYKIVVTQIPYQVEKSKLIERIANLLADKKLPFLDDVQDESADDIRLVLQPKSRNVDPAVLMESLFRQTDLETRVSLNMNVLNALNVPSVMSLKEILQCFLMHRQIVQKRRAEYRLDQIATRLEVLAGYLVAYLNLDEVIQIIREEDDPKAALMTRFDLTQNQADAILNMRLRSLRKLQELEIRKEHADLEKEQKGLNRLLASPKLQWQKIQTELGELITQFGKHTALGARRTVIAGAPEPVALPLVDEIEKEDVTIICSNKNWIRSVKGHLSPESKAEIKYKDGDEERFVLPAQTTDKFVLFATNGRFYTIGVDKIPRTRGPGEALRLLVDLENTEEILNAFIIRPDKLDDPFLVASTSAHGFLVLAKDILAQTKSGKQVLTLADKERAHSCVPVVESDSAVIAVIGENRKLLIFPVQDLPIMSRGRGVTLQKYKDGSMSDLVVFPPTTGLRWVRAGKSYLEKDLRTWQGRRASSGRLAPIGFPRSNKFKG